MASIEMKGMDTTGNVVSKANAGADASSAASSNYTAAFREKASALMNAAKMLAISVSPMQIMLWIALAIGLGIAIWYIIYKVNQKQNEISSTYVTLNRTVSPLNTLTNQAAVAVGNCALERHGVHVVVFPLP